MDLVHASEGVAKERSTFLSVQARVMMAVEQPDENEHAHPEEGMSLNTVEATGSRQG